MADKELRQSIDRARQDAVNLDFTEWSFQRRQAKQSATHSEWLEVRDATLARQRWENAEARSKHLNKLATAKVEKRLELEREIELELQPQKQRLMREWLANNPTFTEADFEKKAWTHLRQNLIEQRERDAKDTEIRAQLATGRY